jgi:hypothetical protein
MYAIVKTEIAARAIPDAPSPEGPVLIPAIFIRPVRSSGGCKKSTARTLETRSQNKKSARTDVSGHFGGRFGAGNLPLQTLPSL